MDVRVSSQRDFNRSPNVPSAMEAVILFQKLRGFAEPAADRGPPEVPLCQENSVILL